MKKMLKRLCTGFLALATVVTALPTIPVHAESKQYWTESKERVGIVEKVMNDGSIGSTFNEGMMKVEGETAYCIDINTDFKNGYKTRADASSRMSADQISDVALSLPPNSLDTESSIKQGCKYFASLLSSCQNQGIDDLNVAIQSYNYGGGYVGYVAGKGKKHTFNLAENFAREKSGGKKVTYTNPIAVAKNGGWRYGYGNMFYVELVNQYLTVSQVSGELAQKVMNEALKYQGWKYVYGGSNPNTSFDCSGLTQWCYGKAGISLPRTAQAQYDATQHLPLSQAKAGDLVFFHSTYNAGSYVTHVGILVSPTQMYHAGNPIGYADLSSSYWQQHLIGAGRVKQ